MWRATHCAPARDPCWGQACAWSSWPLFSCSPVFCPLLTSPFLSPIIPSSLLTSPWLLCLRPHFQDAPFRICTPSPPWLCWVSGLSTTLSYSTAPGSQSLPVGFKVRMSMCVINRKMPGSQWPGVISGQLWSLRVLVILSLLWFSSIFS